MWSPTGPLAEQAAGGAELNININGSPYHVGKASGRERMLATRAADAQLRARLRQPGRAARTSWSSTGHRWSFDADGDALARAAQFVEELLDRRRAIEPVYRKRLLDPRGRRTEVDAADWCTSPTPRSGASRRRRLHRWPRQFDADAELYDALVLGTGDYVRKNGFTDVVIGLSGGIDSTIVACIAVDALGADHVHGVSMPSRYSSDGSKTDAAGARRATSASTSARSPIEPAFQRLPRHAGAVVRGPPAGPHRGEPAEPGPRRRR